MAFYISLENKLDIDHDSDIISSHTGGGGGGCGGGDGRRRIHFNNPGFQNRISFSASLN